MSQEIRRLASDLKAHLEWQGLLGVDALPGASGASHAAPDGAEPRGGSHATPARAITPGRAGAGPGLPGIAAAELSGAAERAGYEGLGRTSSLEALRELIGDCRRCSLCTGRTQVVFGVGNPGARLVFVGEGPGHDEDLRGEPFVGRAGQLLTDIIEKGMRIARADVYICNVVKCRPPGNRNPEPEEVGACAPFLVRQIEILQPEVLVALGKFAAQTLLESKTPIMRLRGTWQEYRGIPLMPTLHPAYLLRNPADKKLVWQDIRMVMARLGLAT